MTRASFFYDIESPQQLFNLLRIAAKDFALSKGKRTQDLLFLVFGLTHLREWIAPDYDPQKPPVRPEELFYQEIFSLREFNILRALCNRTKHMEVSESAMGALYGAKIDDWPEISSITNIGRGPPIAYFVDGHDVEDIIRIVISKYEEWFQRVDK